VAKQYCEKCGTKHEPGDANCPMAGGGRRSRKKADQGGFKKGDVTIAAHRSDWSRNSEFKDGQFYLSSWSCTVCGKMQGNRSTRPHDPPPDEQHEATKKK